MTEIKEPVLHHAVVIGYCTLADKKPGIELRTLADDGQQPGELPGEELLFSRKAFPHAVIGGVYLIPQVDEKSWRLSQRRYVGMYHDIDRVAQWQLEAKAKQMIEDALKLEAGAQREVPEAMKMLEPLRVIYRKQFPNGKRAIELLLLEYLRRGA